MAKTSDNKNNTSSTTSNSRIVRVRDLPIYYDVKNEDIYRHASRIDDDQSKVNNKNWLYSSVSQTRQSLQQIWNDNKALREKIVRGADTSVAHTKATLDYIRDDQTFFPKVAVVTVAGLGGLLLGHRGGVVRKTFYSSVAATVALSACYPKQSANLFDQVYVRIKNETRNLFDKTTSTNQPTLVQLKDRILHTTKTANEPVIAIKGDYGQGTPADQHLYTTRGGTASQSETKS